MCPAFVRRNLFLSTFSLIAALHVPLEPFEMQGWPWLRKKRESHMAHFINGERKNIRARIKNIGRIEYRLTRTGELTWHCVVEAANYHSIKREKFYAALYKTPTMVEHTLPRRPKPKHVPRNVWDAIPPEKKIDVGSLDRKSVRRRAMVVRAAASKTTSPNGIQLLSTADMLRGAGLDDSLPTWDERPD